MHALQVYDCLSQCELWSYKPFFLIGLCLVGVCLMGSVGHWNHVLLADLLAFHVQILNGQYARSGSPTKILPGAALWSLPKLDVAGATGYDAFDMKTHSLAQLHEAFVTKFDGASVQQRRSTGYCECKCYALEFCTTTLKNRHSLDNLVAAPNPQYQHKKDMFRGIAQCIIASRVIYPPQHDISKVNPMQIHD